MTFILRVVLVVGTLTYLALPAPGPGTRAARTPLAAADPLGGLAGRTVRHALERAAGDVLIRDARARNRD